MAALCRYDGYEVIVAQLEGGTYAVDICDLPAIERVTVARAGDGLAVEIHVSVCTDHAALIGEGDDGFIETRELATASP